MIIYSIVISGNVMKIKIEENKIKYIFYLTENHHEITIHFPKKEFNVKKLEDILNACFIQIDEMEQKEILKLWKNPRAIRHVLVSKNCTQLDVDTL